MDSKIVLYVAVVSLFLTVIVFLFLYNEINKLKKQLNANKISNNETVSLIQRMKLCEEKINNIKGFVSQLSLPSEQSVEQSVEQNVEQNVEKAEPEKGNVEKMKDTGEDACEDAVEETIENELSDDENSDSESELEVEME
tara:strand:- start:645 stop:1064 length:420 start_codon:yes stop_codon:yes gene_type:complete